MDSEKSRVKTGRIRRAIGDSAKLQVWTSSALGARMHLLSTGTATARDIGEATRLMMPGKFSRMRSTRRIRKRA
jgi:hypothetical protein